MLFRVVSRIDRKKSLQGDSSFDNAGKSWGRSNLVEKLFLPAALEK
jgi:hypothetical protein